MTPAEELVKVNTLLTLLRKNKALYKCDLHIRGNYKFAFLCHYAKDLGFDTPTTEPFGIYLFKPMPILYSELSKLFEKLMLDHRDSMDTSDNYDVRIAFLMKVRRKIYKAVRTTAAAPTSSGIK